MTDRSLAAAPLLPPAAAFAIGIAAASWLTLPSWVLLTVGTVLLLAAAAIAGRGPRLSLALVLVAVVTLGVLRAAPPALPDDHVARLGREGALTLEGRLAQEPVRWAPDRMRLLLDVEAAHLGPERLPATGRVQLTIYGELASPLGEGQRVLVDARVHPPIGYRNPGSFDYPAHLRREGILLVGHARGAAHRAHPGRAALAGGDEALGGGRDRDAPARDLRRAPRRAPAGGALHAAAHE